jgi:hypothetical protein
MDFEHTVQALLGQLRSDVADDCGNEKLLNFVLVDSSKGNYPEGLSAGLLRHLGIELIDVKLVSQQSAPYYDNDLLVSALLSLA